MSQVQGDVSQSIASLMGTATTLSPAASSAVSSVLWHAYEQDESNETCNPYLEVLPAFTYSMPVQLVILGVTVTLLGVLLVHLLFTIRYHLPLSRVNYAFQTTAVVLCLCNASAQLQLVMHNLYNQGRSCPFAYDYIEVAIPPPSWSQPKRGAWLFLQGLSSLITHSTHIQFLTMLFPSALEARLILGLLGPLALATAGLTFTSLSPHPAVIDLGDAIRNTANSSLTLLYTLALFIWGLTLNRKRAWRTDGGTATFGILALVLGVLGTAVNFVEIREDRMRWLPGVVTCVLLWQSWVGFWWWVGAGMWTGEAEDVERRQAKKIRRAEAKKAKKESRERELRGEGGAGTGTSVAGGSIRRRTRRVDAEGEEIELQDLNGTGGAARPHSPRPARPAGSHPSDASVSSGSTPPPSHHFYSPVLAFFAPFFARLRVAHDAAAVAKAALPPGLPDDVRRGWGIRALMLKGKRERGERREAAVGAAAGGEVDASERRAGFEADGGARLGGDEWEDDDDDDDSSSDSGEESEAPERRRTAARSRPTPRATNSYPPPQPSPGLDARPPRETGEEEEESVDWAGRGMDGQWRGWRGAIARWRLADVSKF